MEGGGAISLHLKNTNYKMKIEDAFGSLPKPRMLNNFYNWKPENSGIEDQREQPRELQMVKMGTGVVSQVTGSM